MIEFGLHGSNLYLTHKIYFSLLSFNLFIYLLGIMVEFRFHDWNLYLTQKKIRSNKLIKMQLVDAETTYSEIRSARRSTVDPCRCLEAKQVLLSSIWLWRFEWMDFWKEFLVTLLECRDLQNKLNPRAWI